ncbi:IPT/TIG domain-containing protein [Parapedobacter tibetensis]|uniref:IPT/TIG domain-containing protein n=1 Tax=Parapedobacter tibetensis TaxID=2972951 RepID=UPI00214DE868|nr:IPT/TIG domain-containing protein [Parapedobacter tibetensis]
MYRYFLSFVVLISFSFVSCESDPAEPLDREVHIEEVTPMYMAEGGTITVKGYGFTSIESENKIEINGIPADFRIRVGEAEVTVPDGTFTVNPYEATIVFENISGNRDTAVFYYEKYPRVYEFHPARAYVGETITIEGDYLDTNTNNTEILFSSSTSELISAEIVSMDNYTIDVRVPAGAESGSVYYVTRMIGEEKVVLRDLGSLTVKE